MEDALRIFTEEVEEVRSLPRQKVLDHLMSCATPLVIPYLEHIINGWKEEDPDLHNKLVQLYQEGVERLLPEYKRRLGKGSPIQ